MYKINYTYKTNGETLENTIKYNVSENEEATNISLVKDIFITFYWDLSTFTNNTFDALFIKTIKKYHKYINNETISSIKILKMKDLNGD